MPGGSRNVFFATPTAAAAAAAGGAAAVLAATGAGTDGRPARYRNGRLATNRVSRTQKPRWRMARLDGEWYDREGLRRWLARRPGEPRVPGSGRRLTEAELAALADSNPWRLS